MAKDIKDTCERPSFNIELEFAIIHLSNSIKIIQKYI